MADYELEAQTGAFGLTGVGATFKVDWMDEWEDLLALHDAPVVTPVVVLSDVLALSQPGNDYAYRPGALVEEVLELYDEAQATTILGVSLAEALRIQELLISGRPVALADQLNVSDVLTALRGAALADQLILGDAFAVRATYYPALLDSVAFRDSFANFFGLDFSDAVQFTETLARTYRPIVTLADGVAFEEAFTPKLLVRFDLADTAAFSDAALLKMIFSGALVDGVQFSIAHVAPDGGFTAWATNASTRETTEYTNWRFNSFAQLGSHHYVGANDEGVFVLEGARDGDRDVIATMRNGLMQINGPQFTGFAAAYLGVRGDGEFLLKMETGDGREYVYAVETNKSMLTTKVDLGRGLRARYFSFELRNVGQEFALESVEFIPMRAQRRV